MEKILKVGEYNIPVRTNAASLFVYKANFKRDGLKDLIAMAGAVPQKGKSVEAKDIAESDFDFDVFFRFLWVFAKAADKSIPPLPEWLEGFDVSPIDFVIESFEQVAELLISTAKTSVKAKN